MSAYNIINPITIEPKEIKYIFKNTYEKNTNEPITNPRFDEEKIIEEIYFALDKKKYDLLFEILSNLPKFKQINELYSSIVKELKKHDYTFSQLMAISTLLYRLSNINFPNVKLPEEFPNYSQVSIETIKRKINKELQNAQKIDLKIQEIVKNMITHYKLEIKNNKNYNNSIDDQLALKLRNILFSFIIDYTRPESNEPLFVKSAFPPGAIRNQRSTKENM